MSEPSLEKQAREILAAEYEVIGRPLPSIDLHAANYAEWYPAKLVMRALIRAIKTIPAKED